ncbi:rhomboid family intramembrane serine protease [Nitrogeniibacter mangrovi]|uniref:Rhomboid family intramembrane serine protease n=2 Tax=Nitrogeniibacter mangrovi TaxID=2016596 RepID=A0A6C1B1E3_9RHOO|nr:rhomboid family intramembrane serine protease [Nitrogeniibacter mangrovi]
MDAASDSSARNPPMPPVTQGLIIVTVLVFMLQLSGAGALLDAFALWPSVGNVLTAPWQLVTYSFLHGSIGHIFFNLFAVYMFGAPLEQVFGPKRFAQLWFASVFSGALMQVLVATLTGNMVPVIGASAGVFGLLLGYGMLFPNRRLMLLFPPIPMPAKVFVVGYGALELFLGLTGMQAGVAHFAHLGGMLGAWLMLRRFTGRRRRG